MKSCSKFYLFSIFALLFSLFGSATAVNPVSADLPTGLTASDWKQIQALLTPTQQVYLKASNTGASDQFGYSVAVSGDTVVVGAYNEDSNATGVDGNGADNSASVSGAAYVFTRSGEVWSQQAYLKASNTEVGDQFGYSVAISGDTIVVGAWNEDSNATGVDGNGADNSASQSGAAYIFTRSGGVWSQQAYLKASNTEADDWFGSVAISGDTIVVGSYNEDSNSTGVNGNQGNNSAAESGAAYISSLIDAIPPTVASIIRANTNPTNAASVDFTVTFSEPVSGVDTTDFSLFTTSVTGASITNVSSGTTTYTVTVNTGSGNGTIHLDVLDDDTILDSASNPLNGGFTSGETYTLDHTLPTVNTFTATSPSTSLNIPITAFTASDNDSVAGYLITESSTAPSAGDSGWTGSAPTTYTVGSSGIYTLYPWAKDAAGNVSAVYGSPVNVTVTTTLTFKSTALHDGWILESSETSGNGGTMNATATVLYLGDNAQKKQYRSILSFTTSSLPDNAVITKVTLKLKRQGITGGGNPVSMFQGFMADVKKGMFGTAPLALADFKVNANKTVGPQSPALTSGWYSLNLTPAKAYVNKLATNSGLTQIHLRFKLDDNNNATANFLKLYSGNAGAANRPQLIIEYYVP